MLFGHPRCDYCGERHAQAELCKTFKARGMSRRSFLRLGGAAAIGLALAPALALPSEPEVFSMHVQGAWTQEPVADIWRFVGTAVHNCGSKEYVDLRVTAQQAADQWCKQNHVVRGVDHAFDKEAGIAMRYEKGLWYKQPRKNGVITSIE